MKKGMSVNMKKIFIGIGIAIILLSLLVIVGIYAIIKDNPDFAPYKSKKYNINYDIKSDIYNLSEIKDEMTSIANKYEKEIKLTSIEYKIENKNNGTVRFGFFRSDYNGKNKACSILIEADILTKKVTNILYEKGNGKRISGYSNEIVNNLDKNILEYIDDQNKSVIITITNFGIEKINKE